MQTEKTAAEIIASAKTEAQSLISKNDALISEQLNTFREKEQQRYNKAVEQAENSKSEAIQSIKNEVPAFDADLEAISDIVLKRIIKTVFD